MKNILLGIGLAALTGCEFDSDNKSFSMIKSQPEFAREITWNFKGCYDSSNTVVITELSVDGSKTRTKTTTQSCEPYKEIGRTRCNFLGNINQGCTYEQLEGERLHREEEMKKYGLP